MKNFNFKYRGSVICNFTYGSIRTLASEVQDIPFTGTSTDSRNHRNHTF